LDDDNAFVDLDRSVAARAAAQKFLSEGGGGNTMTSQLFIGNDTGGRGGGGGGTAGNKCIPRIAISRALKAHHKLFVTAVSERDKRVQSHLDDMAAQYADPAGSNTPSHTAASTKKKMATGASAATGKKRERDIASDDPSATSTCNDSHAMWVHSLSLCGPAKLSIAQPAKLEAAGKAHDDDDDIVLEERISDTLLRFLDGDLVLPPHCTFPPTTAGTSNNGILSGISTVPTSLVGIPLTCSYYSMAAPTLDCIEVPAGPHPPSLAVGGGKYSGSGTVLGGLRRSTVVDLPSGGDNKEGHKNNTAAATVTAQFLNRPYVSATTGPGMSSTIPRPNISSTSSTPPLLCSVCWLPAPNLCSKCGVARFCCVECSDVHDATRCNKFVV
jgi:hypothetical protein